MNIVYLDAPKASLISKTWNRGRFFLESYLPQIQSSATNPSVVNIGLRARRPSLVFHAVNPRHAIVSLTAKTANLYMHAFVNKRSIYSLQSNAKLYFRATNPKAFEPIRFRRCGA